MQVNKIDNNTSFGAKILLEGRMVRLSAKKAREIDNHTAQDILNKFYNFLPKQKIAINEIYAPGMGKYSDRTYVATNVKTGKEFTAPSTYLKSFYVFLENLMDINNPEIKEFWGKNVFKKASKLSDDSILSHPVFVK